MHEHTIFIGSKPFMNYVTVAVMEFTSKSSKKIIIKARGKFISRAVDVAEVLRNKFITDLSTPKISIGSESFTSKEGNKIKVSAIEIILERKEENKI